MAQIEILSWESHRDKGKSQYLSKETTMLPKRLTPKSFWNPKQRKTVASCVEDLHEEDRRLCPDFSTGQRLYRLYTRELLFNFQDLHYCLSTNSEILAGPSFVHGDGPVYNYSSWWHNDMKKSGRDNPHVQMLGLCPKGMLMAHLSSFVDNPNGIKLNPTGLTEILKKHWLKEAWGIDQFIRKNVLWFFHV